MFAIQPTYVHLLFKFHYNNHKNGVFLANLQKFSFVKNYLLCRLWFYADYQIFVRYGNSSAVGLDKPVSSNLLINSV